VRSRGYLLERADGGGQVLARQDRVGRRTGPETGNGHRGPS